MRLLEYLVPSRARRELMRTLRSQVQGLTVRQLSRQAAVAYSSTHREVEHMRDLGLVRVRRVGIALLCSWDPESRAARALEPLLEGREGLGDPPEDQVFWNLKHWGAPLAGRGDSQPLLSLESTLAHGLTLARRHPDVARVWPVVLARNRSEADLRELSAMAVRSGQKRALGLFLSLTGELLRDPSLADFAERLRDRRFRRTGDFFPAAREGRARKLADLRTPAVARAWRFRMNMPLEAFKSTFEKFVRQP